VGHRALARSLSDVAAMGGTPQYALISLAISQRTKRAWLEEFYAGVFSLAQRYGVAVVGGDTAVVPGNTTIDVTVAGEIEQGKAIRRAGARAGDQLFVSGRLGISALGLRCLRARARPAHLGKIGRLAAQPVEDNVDPIQVHFFPEPRCALGRFLVQKKLATALIDLSDGLSKDLARLCEASRVGARVWAERIPGPPASYDLRSADALNLALHGGEDYELLFTVPAQKAPQVPRRHRGVPLYPIGEISPGRDLLLASPDGHDKPLKPAGYDHFAKAFSSSKKLR
jgi:thiamine-monophosphate kinase